MLSVTTCSVGSGVLFGLSDAFMTVGYPGAINRNEYRGLNEGRPHPMRKSLKRLPYAVVAAGLLLGLAACSNPTPTHQPNDKIPTGTVPKSPGGNNGAP